MKSVRITLTIFAMMLVTGQAQARETLVCAIKETANPRNYSSVVVDLTQPLEEVYVDQNGINVGEDHFSFTLEVTRPSEQKLELNVIFQENLHVQDEIGNALLEIVVSQNV